MQSPGISSGQALGLCLPHTDSEPDLRPCSAHQLCLAVVDAHSNQQLCKDHVGVLLQVMSSCSLSGASRVDGLTNRLALAANALLNGMM